MNDAHRTILHLLATGPKTGRELVERADGALQRGTVYVHLQVLEDRGLVTSEALPVEGRDLPLRCYAITDAGRAQRTDESPGEGFVQTSKPGAAIETWTHALTPEDKKKLDVGDFFTPSTVRVLDEVAEGNLTAEEGALLATARPSMWRALKHELVLFGSACAGFIAVADAVGTQRMGAYVTGFAMGAWVFLTVMFLDRGMRRYSDEALRRARRRWAEVQAERSKPEASP